MIDNKPKGPYVASLYPAGLSQEEAFRNEGFIYMLFSHKDAKWPDLKHLIQTHEKGIREFYLKPRFDYIETVKREDCQIKLRALELRDAIEYSLYMDYPEVIILLNLLSPKSKSKDYLKKLEWTAEKLLKGRIFFDEQKNPLRIILDKNP